MGIINSARKSPTNEMLKKTEDSIEKSVPPQLKGDYLKIVVSGLKILFDKKTNSMVEKGLTHSQDISKNIATMSSGTVGLVYQQAMDKQKFNAENFANAGLYAAIVFMLQILDFAEKTGVAQVTPELIKTCLIATKESYFAKCRVTPEQVQQLTSQAQSKQQPAGA